MKLTNTLIAKIADLKKRNAPLTDIRDALETAAAQAKKERHPAYLSLSRRANAINHFISVDGVVVDNRGGVL